MAGNDDYVVVGGEFPAADGMEQQGLVRYAGGRRPQRRGPGV